MFVARTRRLECTVLAFCSGVLMEEELRVGQVCEETFVVVRTRYAEGLSKGSSNSHKTILS